MKILKSLWALLPFLVVTIGLYSCGDDDDEVSAGGGKASTSAGMLDKKTGLRIKSFGNYSVYYSDDGKIDYIRDSYGRWTFSYNPNKITFVESYNGYSSDEESLSVGYNSAGYLASTSYSDSGQDGNDKWNESSKATLSYDGSGHLTKIVISGKESGTEDGERYSCTWDDTYTLTWRNNQLTQVVGTEKEVEDGVTETETETWTFSYDSDNNENIYRQWAPSIGQCIGGDMEEIFAYVGLLGVGPSVLPSRYEEEYYDGKLRSYENSYAYRYGFNNDGSIAYTYVNNSRYDFSYDYAETNNRPTRSATALPETKMSSKIHSLFKHSHRHH